MKILVANLGSTSFKYRLFDMADERQLARGGIERIGSESSLCRVEIGGSMREQIEPIPDHAAAVRLCLDQLTDSDGGCLEDAKEVAAIGFKAVHGGRISGVRRVDEDVLDAMQEMSQAAPAHNPPYIDAMRLLGQRLPDIPLIAAFETGFHQTIPEPQQTYGVPHRWADELQIRRWGFHGASHRYIADRTGQLMDRTDARIISCHLGGSSSLCAIRAGCSVATTMGMSPQTGLSHNNRCGDFDPFALPRIMRATGQTLDETLEILASQSGLLGVSGISGDVRDLEQAAEQGDRRARLAIDMFVAEIRRYLGSLMVALCGIDAIVFTGGIGENGSLIRTAVCAGLEEFGIELDPSRNRSAQGESRLECDSGRVQIWRIPTNEELVVARQTKQLLES